MARIAVIGAGNIGGTLGEAWTRAGHEVTFGVRDPDGRDGREGRFATPQAAVADAGIVLFAVPGSVADATVRALEPSLHGKVIIDATNRIGTPTACCQVLQDLASDHMPVYRAFNSLGWETFHDPHYGDEVADLFYSGPDGPARAQVEGLISDVGLRPIYVGTDPSVVDGALRLWFALVANQKVGRRIALKVLTR